MNLSSNLELRVDTLVDLFLVDASEGPQYGYGPVCLSLGQQPPVKNGQSQSHVRFCNALISMFR